VTAVLVGITLYGVVSIAGGLLLAIRAEPIRARILRNSSGGVAALIRAIGILVTLLGAAFVLIGVGNLVVQA